MYRRQAFEYIFGKPENEKDGHESKSNGTLYPMLQLPPDKMKLENFNWFDYIRPLNKEDIFNWRGKKAGQELKKSNRGAAPLPNQDLFNKRRNNYGNV